MKDKIFALLEQKKFNALFELLAETNVVDISSVMGELAKEDMIRVFRLLAKDEATEVFSYMEPDDQVRLISMFSDRELGTVLEEMYLDDTVDMINEMPATVVRRILSTSSAEQRKLINEFLKYPEDSAGSLMTNEFVDLKLNMSVRECIEKVRRDGIDKETIYTCYVLDETRRLIGIADIKDMLLADFDCCIGEIMESSLIFASTVEDKEDVAKKFSKYDLIALPVVDSENRLVGIVTVDDAIDVIIEETAEDFEIMSAISPSDETYFKTSVFSHARNRIFWLLILMFSSIISGSIISRYNNIIEMVPLLVVFLPMLMDTGGNCGVQTSTMIIRGMATDEIFLKDFPKALWKEFRISLYCAAVLSSFMFIRTYLQYRDIKMAVIISLAMIGAVIAAKVVSCVLPMLTKKMKLDPALIASPLITTVVDAFSTFLYFNIAIGVMNSAIPG